MPTNHLANHHERILSKNALPHNLGDYHRHHQALTVNLQTILAPSLGEGAKLCTVARFHQGELVLSVASQTLANHLRLLHDNLVQTLNAHEPFLSLTKIHAVYLPTT